MDRLNEWTYMTEQRTPVDLQRYIELNQVTAELMQERGATPTVPAAAAALGVATDQIDRKSVV